MAKVAPKTSPKASKNTVTKAQTKDTTRFFDVIYVLGIIISFFIVYVSIFDPKVGLSGDNMDYYILGKSIATGKGYSNISLPTEPAANHFPPGYPFIISLLILIKDSIITLKVANGVFYCLSLVISYFLFNKVLNNRFLSFVICLLVLPNYHALMYATDEMSEMPFLFFASISMFLLLHLDLEKPFFKNVSFFILIACLSISYYIRSVGIGLVFGCLVYFVWSRKWMYLVATISGFVVSILPWTLRGMAMGGNSYTNQLRMINPYNPELGMAGPMDFVYRILNNIQRYFAWEIPNLCFPFLYKNKPLTYEGSPEPVDYVLGAIVCGLIAYGLFKLPKYRSFFLSYFIGTAGVLMLWPDVWFGIRFILPSLPLIIFCWAIGLKDGIEFILNTVLKRKMALPAVVLLIVGILHFNMFSLLYDKAKAPYPIQFKHYFDIAKWAKDNTDKNAVFCCRKPSLFFYFAQRHCTNYAYLLDDQQMLNDLKAKKVNFVVLEQLGFASTSKYLFPTIQKHPQKFPVILHLPEPDTYLLGFNP